MALQGYNLGMGLPMEKIWILSDLFMERLNYRTLEDADVSYLNPFCFRVISKLSKVPLSTVEKRYKEWKKKSQEILAGSCEGN